MKKIIHAYAFLISNRDFISFFSGIIVSGYSVSISLNPDNTIWHWITVCCGLIAGVLLYVLLLLGKNFEDNIKANASNDPLSSDNERIEQAWDSINDPKLQENKILRLLPQYWVPLASIGILGALFLGILMLNIGNSEKKQEDYHTKYHEQNIFLKQIDSLNRSANIKSKEREKELRDSIHFQRSNFLTLKKRYDSLLSVSERKKKLPDPSRTSTPNDTVNRLKVN